MIRTLALCAGLAYGGCGDESPPAPLPLEPLSNCAAAWQPLTARAPYDIVSPLAHHGGDLYYSTLTTQEIRALPTAGGAARVLAPVFGRRLSIEGDHVMFTGGDRGNLFFRLPLTGGTPELLLDAASGRPDSGVVLLHFTTPTEFFWGEGSITSLTAPTTFWRASRAGGSSMEIGRSSATVHGEMISFSDMAPTAGGLVLASILGIAQVLPFDGSPARSLATTEALSKGEGHHVGIDGAGVYWSLPRQKGPPEDDFNDVVLAPADGSPVRTFWTDLPPRSFIGAMWPDGAGGWVAWGGQRFADDDATHTTIWLLGADGAARRLACSPGIYSDTRIEARPAVAPDAVYVAAMGASWQIVRIPIGAGL
jgi:hypothetical protein